MELLIFTPIQFTPISVCTENAKSSGIAPLGKEIRSPLGVNTKT